ncbi:MAG TPA: O-acetyl-ADP-ribose deacetylase, partial [Candidatus Nanoarchaeia archaeon]|nr:O-acetyl-ADP-ribose deacetylase [Candidatus Nanoarchaeia archaeon]
MYKFQFANASVRFIKGDITEMTTDAIVNAANQTLMGGGGVDGAIHKKGGPSILEECKKIRNTQYPDGLPTGQAVITTAGNLKAKRVIHTVGPIWRGGKNGEPEQLRQAYLNSLQLAIQAGLKTISFPSISSGAYGYPIEEASRVALKAVKDFLLDKDSLDEIVFVLFNEINLSVYHLTATKIFES